MDTLAACHVHSRWSYDGHWSLEELVSAFSARRYRVVMMTEHDRGFSAERLIEYREACAHASRGDLLVIPGIEYSDPANRVHVLVWGDVPFFGENLATHDVLQAASAAGGIAVMAHPARKQAWQCFETRWANWLTGIELWNRKSDGWSQSEPARALLASTGLVPFAGLDFHSDRQFFPLSMALRLAGTPTEATVLDSLRRRQCEARAFGLSIADSRLAKVLPLLNAAEQARRTIAQWSRHR